MNIFDKMHSTELYDPGDGEIIPIQTACLDRLYDYNMTRPTEVGKREALLKEMFAELGEGWVANETLAIAVYCALHYEHDFKAGVLEAINITGDSDSTGAITGNIAGAINGEDAIPASWLNNLREYTIVSQAADDLHSWFESDEYGHCTPEWWDKYPGY